jgi:hypothetical protein
VGPLILPAPEIEAPALDPVPVATAAPPAAKRPPASMPQLPDAGLVGLDFGQVVVPFGQDPARTRTMANLARRRRMLDTERDLLDQGLVTDGAAPGMSARIALRSALTVDVAVLAPAQRRELQLDAPDLAVRAGFGPSGFRRGAPPPGARQTDGVAVGVSAWAGAGGADRAVAVDAGVRAGPWDVRAGADWQRTTRAREAFDEELSFKRVWGDGVSVDVRRTLFPGWTLDAASEARVFLARGAVAMPPWVRSAVGLTADPPGPLRWTLVEVAGIEMIGLDGPGPDAVRVSTRIDAARWR